jgi:hypothetical protein
MRRSNPCAITPATRAQDRGVANTVSPRRSASTVVSSRSGRVRMNAVTAGCSPFGTAYPVIQSPASATRFRCTRRSDSAVPMP